MGKKALTSASMDVDTLLSHEDIRSYPDGTYVLPRGNMIELYKLSSYISDRDFCEKDLARLQYLPYIRLSYEVPSTTIEGGVDQYVFIYQRGKAGGESRLLDQWSIGLGGHVEQAPTATMSLFDVLADCAQRELQEEIGVTLDIEVFKRALLSPVVMRDRRTPTEAVHLGLFMDIRVERDQVDFQFESNIIENGAWMLLRDVQAKHAAGEFVPGLEPWSVAFSRIPLPQASHFA